MKTNLLVIAFLSSTAATAQDVVIIGEIHDNPRHHEVQAEKVSALQPAAIVFEMLTADQVSTIPDDRNRSPGELAEILDWENSGWPDFSMYYPIIAAAPEATIFGAGISRENARAAISGDKPQEFQEVIQTFGLDNPLPHEQQTSREALQMAAHCNALPETLLPRMVQIQRLRDAVLADTIRQAAIQTGGTVAVITGNGHARRDWGIPALLTQVAPELDVLVIGQTEDGHPLDGGFDQIVTAPPVDRPDPCEAFN